MVETFYSLNKNVSCGKMFCIIADLHEGDYADVLSSIERNKPDAILVPGDLANGVVLEKIPDREASFIYCMDFLNTCSKIAPTLFSFGNHEKHFSRFVRCKFVESDAIILDNSCVQFGDMIIGGIPSVTEYNRKKRVTEGFVNLKLVEKFSKQNEFKIMLSHHPEYYSVLKGFNIDVIVSGTHMGAPKSSRRGLIMYQK